jgi:hypothetical protein
MRSAFLIRNPQSAIRNSTNPLSPSSRLGFIARLQLPVNPCQDQGHDEIGLGIRQCLSFPDAVPFFDARPAAGGGGVLGNKDRMILKGRLFSVACRKRRRDSGSDKVKRVSVNGFRSLGVDILTVSIRQLKTQPKTGSPECRQGWGKAFGIEGRAAGHHIDTLPALVRIMSCLQQLRSNEREPEFRMSPDGYSLSTGRISGSEACWLPPGSAPETYRNVLDLSNGIWISGLSLTSVRSFSYRRGGFTQSC